MSVPAEPVTAPAPVTEMLGADAVPVWRNQLGGITWRSRGPADIRYLRWSPQGIAPDALGEALRLRWARQWLPVPEVLDLGGSGTAWWLVTRGLPGRSAVDPYWLRRPGEAALAVGRGLRALHQALPVAGCPFSWSVRDRTAHKAETPELSRLLAAQPEDEVVVVCHGDACAPNLLLADDGSVTGHLDLGRLGVADRWADLAAACWSADHNYGEGHADLVCEGYGVAPDRGRLSWYLALWKAEDEPGQVQQSG